MIEFSSTTLDRDSLRAQQFTESILFGRRPRVAAYSNQGYAGGNVDDYERNWVPLARHPDSELIISRNYLLARCYEQNRNNILASGPTEVLATAVGELMPTSMAADPESRKILERSWREWCEQAGSDGVSTWGETCESMVGSCAQAGDVGVQFDHRPDLGGPHPLRINLIDGYRIASPSDPSSKETERFGVVYDRGAETAYYVAREDATTLGRAGFYRFDRIRNGRPNFTLLRRPDSTRRPGQSRGTPICARVLTELKELADYRRAAVRSAGKRARLTAIIEAGDPAAVKKYFDNIARAEQTNPSEANALREGSKPTLTTTPDAATLTLPPHQKFIHAPTDTTDSGYDTFVYTNLKIIANEWQLPFEVAYQIWQDASYSRARILYLREGVTAKRWRTRMTPVANTVWRLHVQYMLAKEKTLKFSPDLFDVRWHGHTQEYMDLAVEISAEAEARRTGVMSPQTAAERTGRDSEVEMDRTIAHVKRFKEKSLAEGLAPEDFSLALGTIDSPPNTSAPTSKKGPP